MSVFTQVTSDELAAWLRNYSVGHLTGMRGIAAGIENTNYFVTTTQARYVLTLFEKLQPHELPFYLDLMAHLSSHGLPCPRPIANLDNAFLGELNGKPAALVTCLTGAPEMSPTAAHCARVGEVLADLHLAGRSYKGHLDNLRGPAWWTATMPELLPFLDDANRAMLADEVESAIEEANASQLEGRKFGIVHCDYHSDPAIDDLTAEDAALAGARYLVDQLGAAAIIGPGTSDLAQVVLAELQKPDHAQPTLIV